MVRIFLLDYGAGNLYSLRCALEKCGASVLISDALTEEVDGIILPGVGSFDAGAKAIARNKEALNEAKRNRIPILGICLGLQLFFAKSEEGKEEGWGIFAGEVKRLEGKGIKVPHMGWNSINIVSHCELLEGIEEGSWFYFVHSYYPLPKEATLVKAEVEYGKRFPCVMAKGSIYGTQFHPEKSGIVGRALLKRFLELCRR